MRVLYISYDGMTDPLGQSQVIPYLEGLSQLGHEITLLSFEKKQRFISLEKDIRNRLSMTKIDWQPFGYTARPPVLSTIWDLLFAKKTARKLHRKKNFQLLHCRSYISAMVGLDFKKKFGIPFLFDMRGFWADERVEGHLWDQKKLIFRKVYRYFKNKEKIFFSESTHIISLTNAGKEEILKMRLKGVSSQKITVIPCCTNMNLFFPSENPDKKASLREKLNISPSSNVISYLGSFGTWYMAEEMFDFFKVFITQNNESVFLIISQDNKEDILTIASNKGLDESVIRIIPAARNEVPELLSLSTATLFFIRPTFSKKASSPTKMGESLSMGIPVICNDGIGDCTEILKKANAGIIVKSFDNESYKKAVEQFEILKRTDNANIRQLAKEYFDLEAGVLKYNKIYQSFGNPYKDIK